MSARRQRPDENRDCESAARPNAIVYLAGNALANRVSHQEPGRQSRELEIRQVKLRDNHRRENRDREPVDKVDEGRKEDERGDPPAQSVDDEGRGWEGGSAGL